MKRENLRDAYPSLFIFGGEHKFLSHEESAVATADERIRSIWPFLVRKVLKFQERLKRRERVNFDPEDTVSELYIALVERDGGWEKDRGKYITYAGAVINHELCAIRDKARTVHSPRNSSCRLKEYRVEEAAGDITPGRLKTANDIRRTIDGVGTIDTPGAKKVNVASRSRTPDEMSSAVEESGIVSELLMSAIGKLEISEAKVIGQLGGLWGHKPMSIHEIAWSTKRSESEVRRIHVNAMRKLTEKLSAFRLSA